MGFAGTGHKLGSNRLNIPFYGAAAALITPFLPFLTTTGYEAAKGAATGLFRRCLPTSGEFGIPFTDKKFSFRCGNRGENDTLSGGSITLALTILVSSYLAFKALRSLCSERPKKSTPPPAVHVVITIHNANTGQDAQPQKVEVSAGENKP